MSCLECLGPASSFLLTPPEKVVRRNGSRVQLSERIPDLEELKALIRVLIRKDLLLVYVNPPSSMLKLVELAKPIEAYHISYTLHGNSRIIALTYLYTSRSAPEPWPLWYLRLPKSLRLSYSARFLTGQELVSKSELDTAIFS